MTAFPVAKLPLHPPGNTNTLRASPGYNERGGDRGRNTQTRGRKKEHLGESGIRLKREKMRHMKTYKTIYQEGSNKDKRLNLREIMYNRTNWRGQI